MRNTVKLVSAGLVAALILGGCIISDQLTTLFINPDGSADLVVYRAHIHSTRSGREAQEELSSYREQFEGREKWPFDRIRTSGGEITTARWVRKEAPMANLVRASLPDAEAPERFASIEGGNDDWTACTRFERQDGRRRLAITIRPPQDRVLDPPPSDADSIRQNLTNSISHARLVPVDGTITDARGFRIAEDNQSALLDMSAFPDKLWTENKPATVWMEWEMRGAGRDMR